jgi:hypothetical protein
VRVDLQAEVFVLSKRVLHVACEVGTPGIVVSELDDLDLIDVRAAVGKRGVLFLAVVLDAGVSIFFGVNLLNDSCKIYKINKEV